MDGVVKKIKLTVTENYYSLPGPRSRVVTRMSPWSVSGEKEDEDWEFVDKVELERDYVCTERWCLVVGF